MANQPKYPNLRIVFNRRKSASETKSASVEIEITHNRNRWRMSTGVKLFSNQWKNGKVVRHPNAAALNNKISTIYNSVSAAVDRLWATQSFTFENLKMRLAQGNDQKLPPIEWMRQCMESLPIRESSKKQHDVTLKAMEKSGLFKSWEIGVATLRLWDSWVRNNTSAKEQSSVYNYHKRLKAYLNRAVTEGVITDNPYNHFTVSKGGKSRPKYLTEQERTSIENVALSHELERVRDVFVVMMYTGLAYSDVAKLGRGDMVEENGKMYIVDKRTKTDSEYKLMVLSNVKAILEKYDYKLPIISNQKMNEYLKLIGAAAGVDKHLTTHMARHTFATWALSKGIPISVVSKMLAHSDIKTTQIYAKVLQEDVNRGFDVLENAL